MSENSSNYGSATEADMLPDLAKLNGYLPPCIAALVGRGAQTALGSWDNNALTLARYVKAARMSPERGAALLEILADHTGPDFPTGKDRDAQWRHWGSIQDSLPFSCEFILPCRQVLGFHCEECQARPAGVKAKAEKTVLTSLRQITSALVELGDNVARLEKVNSSFWKTNSPVEFLDGLARDLRTLAFRVDSITETLEVAESLDAQLLDIASHTINGHPVNLIELLKDGEFWKWRIVDELGTEYVGFGNFLRREDAALSLRSAVD